MTGNRVGLFLPETVKIMRGTYDLAPLIL